MVTFSPRRPNKVLVREHLRRACEFYNHLGDVCGEYGIRTGMHNHSQGQLVETQDEIEMLLNWTDPRKFHWCPDTVHLYMANCDIVGLFRKYAQRLIFFDLVDAKYEYQKDDMRLPNGKIEKAIETTGTAKSICWGSCALSDRRSIRDGSTWTIITLESVRGVVSSGV
jgi:sugar phosphate isomerase/epimerase